MTNDFSVEQKKPSVLPYAGLGAVAGGVTGYAGLPKWTGKPMTHEDLIKEIEDTATFSDKVKEGAQDADLWKEAEAKNKAVKDAEKALEEASKPVLKDCKEYSEFNTAQKNFDDAIAELERNKAAELRRTSGTTTRTIKGKGAAQFVSPDAIELKSTELTEYKKLYDAYKTAYDAQRASITDSAKVFETKTEQALKDLTDASMGKKGSKVSKEVKSVMDSYRTSYLEKDVFPAITDADVVAEFNKRTGSTVSGISAIPKKSKNAIRTELENSRKDKVKQAMDEIFGEKQMIEFKQGIATSKATRPTYARAEELRYVLSDNKKALDEFDKVLAKKGLVRSSLPSSCAVETLIKDLENNKGSITVAEYTRRLNELKDKLALAKKHEKINAENATRLESFWAKFNMRNQFAENVEKEINKSSGVRDAFKALRDWIGKNQLKDKAYASTETVTSTVGALSEEEIARQAKEYAQTNVKKELRDVLEAKEKAYRAKAATEGKIDEAAKKAAEEKLGTVKNEFKEAAQKLIDKLPKKPGVKPIVGALIGAGAIGLAGWLIAPKKPKEA